MLKGTPQLRKHPVYTARDRKSSLKEEILFGIFVSLPPTAASRTPPHTFRNSSRLGLFRSNLEEISLVYLNRNLSLNSYSAWK
jgi:hypothetical protein